VPVSLDTIAATTAHKRDFARPMYAALCSDRPFTQVSSGFVGTPSDGLAQLDADRALATTYSEARGGNVVQTALVPTGGDGAASLALGFGSTQATAVQLAGVSARTPFLATLATYSAGWVA